MRMIKSKLVLFAIAVVFCSCSKEKSPDGGYVSHATYTLTVADSLFCVSSNSQKLTIDIKTSGVWNATTENNWISFSSTGKQGDGQLVLSVAENTDKYYPRTGYVYVTVDKIKVPIEIFQESQGVKTFSANGITFKMIPVKGGTFIMGEDTGYGEIQDANNKITLTKDYYLGEAEVTQSLSIAVIGNPGYKPMIYESEYTWITQGDNYPSGRLTYADCKEFIEKLNQMTNQIFRIPTEAEWEFAAKGGNKSKGYEYSGSNDIKAVAWYEDNSNGKVHEVKSKHFNELGFYDMSGNICEWCDDGDDYHIQPLRGGDFSDLPGGCTVYHRSKASGTQPLGGFRIAMDM